MNRLSSSPLSPETWPFDLDELPTDACLVGGAVRDALLDRRSVHLDLDFIVPNRAIEIARAVSVCHAAGFVVLDAAREIARVVFPSATVDFALREGCSLEADLQRRDFTVNAIAYDPRTARFIDPLDGRADLERKHLRMISAENLQDDPLRLLRAYRQAAQLGFEIDGETRAAIRELAPELSRVAAERVYAELGYLLAGSEASEGTRWLQRRSRMGYCVCICRVRRRSGWRVWWRSMVRRGSSVIVIRSSTRRSRRRCVRRSRRSRSRSPSWCH